METQNYFVAKIAGKFYLSGKTGKQINYIYEPKRRKLLW